MIVFTEWLKTVDKILRSIGHKHYRLCEKSWKALYDEHLSPFKAVSESEFDGLLTWAQYRKLTNYKPF